MTMIRKVGSEWKWTQRHSCGHSTYQAVFGGAKPSAAEQRMNGKPCPRCGLIDLLQDNFGERAADDIAAIKTSFIGTANA